MDRIVVGVDGSEGSRAALRWAAEEAALRAISLTALHAWDLGHELVVDGEAAYVPGYDQDAARANLSAFVVETLGVGHPAALDIVCDLGAPALLERSSPETLLVIGSRGAGGFKGMILGSVSQRVATRAAGPVVVVPLVPVRGDGVVVGIDGSEVSRAALRTAAEEARVRQVPLTLVSAWAPSAIVASPWMALPDADLLHDLQTVSRERLAAAAADPALDGVEVHTVLAQGSAAGALLDQQEAGLLVVGSKGHSRLAGLVLGSTTLQVLHHADVPVLVIHAP